MVHMRTKMDQPLPLEKRIDAEEAHATRDRVGQSWTNSDEVVSAGC